MTPEKQIVNQLAADLRVIASNYLSRFAAKDYDMLMKRVDKNLKRFKKARGEK